MKEELVVDSHHEITPRRYRPYGIESLGSLKKTCRFTNDEIDEMRAVATVFPFRTNNYVVDEVIDWDAIPEDPIFRLTFPQKGMLGTADLQRMLRLIRTNAPASLVNRAAREIQESLNPHPAGQLDMNVPTDEQGPIRGLQHKYRETVLLFPSQGQTCHAYCTYCFRWAQFIGDDSLKLATRESETLARYLRRHKEVSSVLLTGGDPMIMRTALLERYIDPLLADDLEHISTIRIGTKAPAYWPYRFVTDPDADDLLRLFEKVRSHGKSLALMAHYSHPRELSTPVARKALRRILDAGAVVRCQAPLIRGVNDSSETWAELWRTEARLGAVPYYMFVERDTGPRAFFEVPLARSLEIFQGAFNQVCGLARTVRGPSMSATPGKICIQGTCRIGGEKAFVLNFIQARDPGWVGKPFFARYDAKATWIDDLAPLDGSSAFFFEDDQDTAEFTGT